MVIVKIFFWIALFMLFWANIGYVLFILLLGKIIKRKNKKIYDYEPTVTVLVPAHNEEKIIEEKLKNLISLDYPKDKLEILITSDHSTDKTNDIVKKFIKENLEYKINLYETKERKGKTNAQNEAISLINSEIIVMSDANAMIDKKAVRELVSSFSHENIAYVTGKLFYINGDENQISNSENTYWSLDTKIREIESNIQAVTAGNGAIYACRTRDYVHINPIRGHDISMPFEYALQRKRAIANHEAKAYEKAGETKDDEFKRKVRMNRGIIRSIFMTLEILNIFKYKWFTVFYLGHRTSRYLLWFNHILLLITNMFLLKEGTLYSIVLYGQLLFYTLALIKQITKVNNKILNIIYYYCMTITAQFVGVYNAIRGKNKPFWEKAESTR